MMISSFVVVVVVVAAAAAAAVVVVVVVVAYPTQFTHFVCCGCSLPSLFSFNYQLKILLHKQLVNMCFHWFMGRKTTQQQC